MRIAIVGAGGVGGYFGGRLAEAGTDVAFLARGAHLDALRTRGLRIVSPKGDAHIPTINATDDPAAIRGADVVFFAVKLYDAETAAAVLPQLVKNGTADTVVIPLQNGVEGVDIVSRAVGPKHTAGGTCYVSAVIAEPGVIKHTAMDHLLFGELEPARAARHERVEGRLSRLLEVCRAASFQSTLSDDIQADIWTKFVRLSVLSGLTTVTRAPLGVTVNDPELLAMLKQAIAEGMAVAHAKGVQVPSSTIDDVVKAYQALPPQTKSSMLEDLERGRRLELPWLSGAVVRIGRELGVPTPVHAFINAVLKPHVNGALA
jgi:2-dehydropantoate 2-reductase